MEGEERGGGGKGERLVLQHGYWQKYHESKNLLMSFLLNNRDNELRNKRKSTVATFLLLLELRIMIIPMLQRFPLKTKRFAPFTASGDFV